MTLDNDDLLNFYSYIDCDSLKYLYYTYYTLHHYHLKLS
jgi:hypothetical protein